MQTNVLIFPHINMPIVELVEYWYSQGYTIGNTRKNHLVLIRIQ